MKAEIVKNLVFSPFQSFEVSTLRIQSTVLKKNPLKDPYLRFNPVLVPKSKPPKEGWPLVFVLAGFGGNVSSYFHLKGFEDNVTQVLDRCVQNGEAPKAVYVFVDAFTFWGGSQFLNSKATGSYEDYIVRELLPAVQKKYSVSKNPQRTCVTGGSSGGYGALHLASQYPQHFGIAAAIAPDSFFELSLHEDLMKATVFLARNSKEDLMLLHKQNKIIERKDGVKILDAIAMCACYSPKGNKGAFDFPVDLKTGEIKKYIFKRWLDKDPIYFLKKRQKNIKKLRAIYLDVGTKDEFYLHFGTRKISQILKQMKIKHHFSEYDGGHFDMAERRPPLWSWLKSILEKT